MTTAALVLVLLAACLHAVWNLCAKRAGGGLPFVYLVGLMINSLYLPVISVYWWWKHPVLPAGAVWWIAGSGALKACYSLFLQRSYRAGDFSLVYPVAGAAPARCCPPSPRWRFWASGRSPLALAGGLVIVASIFLLADGARLFRRDRSHLRTAVRLGLTSGVFIAAYTIWDRHGVAALAIAPVLYDAGTALTQLVLLTPFALRRWPEVVRHWRDHRLYAAGVAFLSPVAYILVLTAMVFTPVSYVAPAREVSIVIGAFIGAKFLKETDARRRLWAAAAMAAGVIALALG